MRSAFRSGQGRSDKVVHSEVASWVCARSLAAAGCSLLFAGCRLLAAAEEAAPLRGILVRAALDTVPLEKARGYSLFRVTVTIANKSNETVLVDRCAVSAEREMAGTWARVWTPICSAFVEPLRMVSPGDSIVREVAVTAASETKDRLGDDPPIEAGAYRLVMTVVREQRGGRPRQELPASQRTTQKITVRS